jgi:hypothetical protein
MARVGVGSRRGGGKSGKGAGPWRMALRGKPEWKRSLEWSYQWAQA